MRTVGAYRNPTRTADQTAEALFYMAPAPRIYGPFAHDLAASLGLDITDSTRLFALLSLALLDSQIACWDAKLAYAQWRPLIAIREAEGDGNPATVAEPNWIPRVPTPPFPDYPAARSCSAGAAAEVLKHYLRSGESIALRSPSTGSPRGSARHADTPTSPRLRMALPMPGSGPAFTSEPRRPSVPTSDRRLVDG